MHRELRGSNRTMLAAAILIVLGTFSVLVGIRSFQPKTFDFDLVAFYCGGDATAHAADPYRTEPLRTCEHAIGSVFRPGTLAVVPDPLPPYDQAFFAGVSHVPYRDVQIAWAVVQIGLFVATVVLLAAVSGRSRFLVANVLLVSDFYCSGILGQIFPISLFGIVLTGWALERGRRGWLVLGLIAALSEPHLGLPVLVAVLAWGTGCRTAAALAAVALAAVSFAAVPLRTIVEYATDVLPAHALAEINNQEQFSLAYALHVVGVPADLALLVAKIAYATSLVAGVVVAGRLSQHVGRAMVAFAPVAFVLLAGPFLHVTQIPAALPAALVLAGRTRSRSAGAACSLLAVPWVEFSTVLTIVPLAAGTFFVALRDLCGLEARARVAAVAAAVSAIVAAAFYVALDAPAHVPKYGVVPASSLAELTWKAVVDNDRHGHVLLFALAKLPTEAGLWIVAASLVAIAFPRLAGVARRTRARVAAA